MRILFVDDTPIRAEKVRKVLRTVGAFTADLVLRPNVVSVTEEDVATANLVFLDRDLCVAGEGAACPLMPCTAVIQGIGCRCPTGEDLVTRILAMPEVPGQRFVVHSVNPGGGQRMGQRLMDAGRDVLWMPIHTWNQLTDQGLADMWGINP